MLYKFLFPSKPDGAATSAILLIVRIIFGVLLMNHGIEKWSNYQELSAVFPDPLGVGSPLSLGLAIFGELACSMAFIIGFLYRLAMLPMIFTSPLSPRMIVTRHKMPRRTEPSLVGRPKCWLSDAPNPEIIVTGAA